MFVRDVTGSDYVTGPEAENRNKKRCVFKKEVIGMNRFVAAARLSNCYLSEVRRLEGSRQMLLLSWAGIPS